ncbi:MAG: FAD-dependent oxidoreductase [Kouleothrix sp.]
MRYTLIEREKRWGGKLLTDTVDDFVIEGGPDSFITRSRGEYSWRATSGLAISSSQSATARQGVCFFAWAAAAYARWHDADRAHTNNAVCAFTLDLASGEAPYGLDLVLPARRDSSDETVADFIRRRLGREALDKLAEPLLSGIHNSETERQSIMATFPALARSRGQARQLNSRHAGQRAASLRRQATAPAWRYRWQTRPLLP